MLSQQSTASLVVLAVGCLAGAGAHAQQAFDVQVQSEGGKIVVGSGVVDEGSEVTQSLTLGIRTFPFQLGSNFGSDNPGFNVEPSGSNLLPSGVEGIGNGVDLEFDFVPATINGVSSNFFYGDGADTNNDGAFTIDDISLAPPTTGQKFFLSSNGDGSIEADGAPNLVEGGLIDTTFELVPGLEPLAGRLHEHRGLGVLNPIGLPIASGQPEGIYIVALQLRVAGLETSDPFFFVYESSGFGDTSDDIAGDNLEPETLVVSEFLDDNYEAIFGLSPSGDFNFDNAVNAADFVVFRDGAAAPGTGLEVFDEFAANFGAGASQVGVAVTSFAVPEPATGFGLAWIVGVAMTRRRR